jgi:hypothetical protein
MLYEPPRRTDNPDRDKVSLGEDPQVKETNVDPQVKKTKIEISSINDYRRRTKVSNSMPGTAKLNVQGLKTPRFSPPTNVCFKQSTKLDLVGVFASVLCSVKCFLLGGLTAFGGVISLGSSFSNFTHLAHSPLVVLPLVFMSFLAASQGLVRPMLRLIFKASSIKNKVAFFAGLGGFSSLILIMGGQLFSGFLLVSLPSLIPSVLGEGNAFSNHLHHYDHNLSAAIVFDEFGPLGLSEASFLSVALSFSHGLFFISSFSLGLLHFLKILSNVRRSAK